MVVDAKSTIKLNLNQLKNEKITFSSINALYCV
jgi:hypothetical protein